ncbi:MAG: hypothetical protein WC788_05950 [Candidatus Paceibacterota bacterium]|jgi:hypothetical protein
MRKEKDAQEMEKDMLENKEEYIGTAITLEGGVRCLVIGIEEEGIRSLPIDTFANMKKNDLKKCFGEIFPAEKVEVAMNEVEKRKKEMNEIYA